MKKTGKGPEKLHWQKCSIGLSVHAYFVDPQQFVKRNLYNWKTTGSPARRVGGLVIRTERKH